MFIASVKLSTLKVAAVLLALGVIVAAALWVNGQAPVKAASSLKYQGVSTNEKRVAFLKNFGWQVDENPVEVVEVTIPQNFNAVYNNYNAIQKRQGFDLTKYRGQRVKRWTYRILNYPGVTDEVHANLLIYKNTVVGGDVSTVALNGFMHGLNQKEATGSVSEATPQSTDITNGLF